MANVQQPEMRRNEENPTVQNSKRPRPGDRPRSAGGGARPVPAEQVSPYGRATRPVGEAGHRQRS